MICIRTFAVLFIAFAVAFASENVVEEPEQSVGRQLTSCLQDGDFFCIKQKIVKNLQKLIQQKSLNLADGVKLEYAGDETTRVATSRAIMNQDWNSLLSEIFPKLIQSLSFNVQEARGIKDRIILPIAAAGGFYTLLITLGVIAAKFLAFKALLVGKVSLVLAAITGLAKIFEQKNQGYAGYQAYDRNYIEHQRY